MGEKGRVADELVKLRGVLNSALDQMWRERQKGIEREVEQLREAVSAQDRRLTVLEVELRTMRTSIDRMSKNMLWLVLTVMGWLVIQILNLLVGGVHP